MFDVIAFQQIAGRAGTVALQNVAGMGAGETHVTVAGNNVTVPLRCSKILAAYIAANATAGSLTNAARLSSPYLGKTALLDLAEFETNGLAALAAALFPGNLADATGAIRSYQSPINDFSGDPVPLQPGENLQLLTSVDVAAVGEFVRGVIFLTDGNLDLAGTLAAAGLGGGPIRTYMADGSAAAVAATYTPTPIVFRQQLEAGTYAVVGMKAASTTGVVARLVFGSGGQGERPGCIMNNTMRQTRSPMESFFRRGNLGVWGYFTHNNPPIPEIVCAAADAAAVQSFAIDVIKVA